MLRKVISRCSGFNAGAWLALAAVLLIAGPQRAIATPLPVETFFKKPEYGGAVLSPSGKYLAVIATLNSRHNVQVLDLDARKVESVWGFDKGDVVRIVWQNDQRMVIVAGDLHRGTGEPPSIFGMLAINRDGKDQRLLAQGFENPGSINLLGAIPDTNDVLLTTYERTTHGMDLELYRVDTATGAKTLISYKSPGHVSRWVEDFDFVPRAIVTDDLDHDRSAWYVRKKADDSPWQKVEEAGFERLKSVPLFFDPDGKILYVDSRESDELASIYQYEIESGKWTGPIISHPERDISAAFVVDTQLHKLVGLRYVDDRPSAVWFDKKWATMQKSVDAVLPDTVNVLQNRGARWIVVAYSDRNPGDAYLLDGKSMKMEKLFSYRPWIKPSEMAATKWIRYPARDGLTIPALLTLPNGSGGTRVPLIVHIHGGPYVQATSWGYDPEVQFLASRGYAVLQPQYRGTDGFGRKFFTAGFRKWGDEMQDDLEDGVKWAVTEGIVDPARVCFYGASYGGYAAIWGAIKNSTLIKCAVALSGPTSIDYMFDNEWTDMSRLADESTLMPERIGDPKTERTRFKRVNPLDNVDRVGVPILLAYGANDRRVPLQHGKAFRDALDKYHKDYEWVVYAHEGHGLNRDESVFDFYHRVDAFLAKYLHGEPKTAESRAESPSVEEPPRR